MKTKLAVIIIMFANSTAFAQHGLNTQLQSSLDEAVAVQQWLEHIYEVGVIVTNDTFTVTAEAKRVATDTLMRAIVYPTMYNWPDAQYLLKNMQIKVGLWHLINLYDDNEASRNAVLQYMLGLEQVFDMKKALTAAFYTYIFFDPEASTIVNGRPVIHRPDLLDEKLNTVRSITQQLIAHQ